MDHIPNGPNPTRHRILVVDDEPMILTAIHRLISRRGQTEVLISDKSTDALAMMQRQEIAVVICDYMMPGMNGMELLSMVRQSWPDTVCIMLTASGNIEVAAEAINRKLIHFFVCKPWKTDDLRSLVSRALEQFSRNKRKQGLPEVNPGVQKAHIHEQAAKATFSLARAVDARDHFTLRHSRQVADFAEQVGKAMGLDEQAVEELRIGGYLHDVGKIGVPDRILLKAGKLTAQEFQTIRAHPMIGVAIVQPLEFTRTIITMVGQHHENQDGSGYPLGLLGSEISLQARIIHAVDAYEAMITDRVYRSARPVEFALAELERYRGIQFDPDVTEVVIELVCNGKMQGCGAVAPDLPCPFEQYNPPT